MKRTTKSAGASIPLILGLIFIVLKLTDNIDWSWWWVLSPFWISASCWLLMAAILGIIVAVHVGRNPWK